MLIHKKELMKIHELFFFTSLSILSTAYILHN